MSLIAGSSQIDSVRASRAGHLFHERWAARRSLQLIFPNDGLFAIAIEGLSSSEAAKPGAAAYEIADLVLYYGGGDNFSSCERLETVQFKYKLDEAEVNSSYLRKTLEKFCATIIGYEKDFATREIDEKLTFTFVTNAPFSASLWEAIESLKDGSRTLNPNSSRQAKYLTKLLERSGISDPARLMGRVEFLAAEKSLSGQNALLRRTLIDWSAGEDAQAKIRLGDLQELILKKAGPSGQRNNLIKREDVLDALDCLAEELYPAQPRFIDVGTVVERSELGTIVEVVQNENTPVLIHADGGVGKTVFIQSLAKRLGNDFEVVVFDCFGGGAYRSESQARHLPSVGLVQIVNELASKGFCDLLLPGGDDKLKIVKAARRRLAQAAKAIRSQSSMRGLVVIIDAADNAQIEATDRKESAFPRLLLDALHDEPVDGVKLLLTARSHRMAHLIGNGKVTKLELMPFSENESRQFLMDRRSTFTEVEFRTAMAQSGRNARVLDYLVQTWDTNVSRSLSATPITVSDLIEQKCLKINSNLHTAGWSQPEICQFFVALALLPPPIPLDELASALGWPGSQVNTAASDLAPMLQLTQQGAIFRDEPTETYVRDTYAKQVEAQGAIADRLLKSLSQSFYACEALPRFLVATGDIGRAFKLVESGSFPSSIQTEFGKRRLTMARLEAALKLAVDSRDYDRVLNVTMRLAQVATANMRGDDFIRRSPALAVKLGDPDALRRLFADKSGWRGARSARLIVANSFSGDQGEAQIQCDSTIRWINWDNERPKEDPTSDSERATNEDFAAVLFQSVIEGRFKSVDENLVRWELGFSLKVSKRLFQLLEQFEQTTGELVLADVRSFIAGSECKSLALKLSLLTRARVTSQKTTKLLCRSLQEPLSLVAGKIDTRDFENAQSTQHELVQAAFAALIFGSRSQAASIIKHVSSARPSGFDYKDRHGETKIWLPIFAAAVRSWSMGKPLTYHHLLPNEVRITRVAQAISTKKDLLLFLADQKKRPRKDLASETTRRHNAAKLIRVYDSDECMKLASAMEAILSLVTPLQAAILDRVPFTDESVAKFVTALEKVIRSNVSWHSETAVDTISRTIGFEVAQLLFQYAENIGCKHADAIIRFVSGNRFRVSHKIVLLHQLALRPEHHRLAGCFAQHAAEQIQQDEVISSRGDNYADLAAALLAMSIIEAREYYRKGLAQLDQMGGEDYQQITSLLNYAAKQSGGLIQPELAQRLMNLCQLVASHEPTKFGWLLFARAASKSIGLPAIAKLVRWNDQDVAKLSYGLPQLACSLAKDGRLNPMYAAYILTILHDEGWHDWQVGDGVSELLTLCRTVDQRKIVSTVLNKLYATTSSATSPMLWESVLKLATEHSTVLTPTERETLDALKRQAVQSRDEYNSRFSSNIGSPRIDNQRPTQEQLEIALTQLMKSCDHSSSVSIDEVLEKIENDEQFQFSSRIDFIKQLQASCPYLKRLEFLTAICSSSKWELDRSIDLLQSSFDQWAGSSAHLASNTKNLVTKLLEHKGVDIFYEGYSNIARRIKKLSDFCGDQPFVIYEVLEKITADKPELDGDDWLGLATSLCEIASDSAQREALELMLSGPTSRIADEIEQGFAPIEQRANVDQSEFVADVIWHLLGNEDAYMRWNVARGITTLVDLGLTPILDLLVDRFDVHEVSAFATKDQMLAYQNSQQWLLIGIARAAFYRKEKLLFLWPKLVGLASRNDLHIIHKMNIARCLQNIKSKGDADDALDCLRIEIESPKYGIVLDNSWATHSEPTSTLNFDYEFVKTEIDEVARLFNISKGAAIDAIAAQIKTRWPNAGNMNDFGGYDRYRRDRHSQHESARESIQKHALYHAVTNLAATRPVIRRGHDDDGASPWLYWRNKQDITFKDGSWLSDHKDAEPLLAQNSLLGPRVGQSEILRSQDDLLERIGLYGAEESKVEILYGRWTSADGVSVVVSSALTEPRGAIGRCGSFSKLPNNDLWLPEFWDDGHYEPRHRRENPFKPLIWAPEFHELGIDQGDEIAAHSVVSRPRLGIKPTAKFKLSNEQDTNSWREPSGNIALKSQVWGKWRLEQDGRRERSNDDGEILWASRPWLAGALAKLNKKLVYRISFWKYGSSHSYDRSTGVRLVLVGLRNIDGKLRFWAAKKASAEL